MSEIIIEPERLLQLGEYSHDQLAQALIDAYFAPIHHIAYSILRDVAAADDAVQETFIRALRSIDRYRPGSNLKGWLGTIVVNCCRDRLRQRQRRRRWRAVLGQDMSPNPAPKPPEKQVMDRETGTILWSAVDELGEKHRIPIILRYVHDLPIRDIAEMMEISEGTVHSRLYYACKKLNKRYLK